MTFRLLATKCCVVIAAAAVAAAIAPGYRAASQRAAAGPSVQPLYWCPMHPEIRGRVGESCSICHMALVPATPADYESYVLDLNIVPRAVRPHKPARVRFYVRDPHTNAIVRRFERVHEKLFHLFIVSQDLAYFAHVHPLLHADGALDVDVTVPRPGAYQLIADFLPTGGAPQLVQKSFVTAGYDGPIAETPKLAPDSADKIVGGTRVKLTMPEPLAGREQLITFDVRDEATGAPVTDLEPYLGATGHLLLASADLAIATHSHPVAEISALAGPTVVFQVLFQRAGDYRMWVQFQRRGQVLTAAFTVPVKGRY